jgi:predicted TIM-barrel enzyme
MLLKTATSLAFATACLTAVATLPAHAQMAAPGGTEVVTNGPQTNSGDMTPSWSARRNVIASQHYDRLLETNRGFRQARMRKECGPITDPELRQQCLASFHQDEPYTGSSTPRRQSRTDSGR